MSNGYTGGIRCVKVGVYLNLEIGFCNVTRLAVGIMAYNQVLQNDTTTPLFQDVTNTTSLFKAFNYVPTSGRVYHGAVDFPDVVVSSKARIQHPRGEG
mmetsp:Transcript_54663/g.63907  ORF Transcript_54663/g.63907 Transcript_54663/m.63907 type:complete len:98 (-) Transcript_54663:273-566(-)